MREDTIVLALKESLTLVLSFVSVVLVFLVGIKNSFLTSGL